MSNKKSNHPIPNQSQKNPRNADNSIISHQQFYNGPIPNASELQRYEHIQTGFADRIISMAENEQQSRLKLNQDNSNKVYDIERRNIRVITRGQWLAFVTAFIIVGVGVYLSTIGYATQGATVICTTLGAAIVAFISGKSKKD